MSRYFFRKRVPKQTSQSDLTDKDLGIDSESEDEKLHVKSCFKLSVMTKKEMENNPVKYNPFIVCLFNINFI